MHFLVPTSGSASAPWKLKQCLLLPGAGGAQGADARRVLELLLCRWLEDPSPLVVAHRPWHKIIMKLLLKCPPRWTDGSLLGENSLVGSMCQEFEKRRGREQLQGW